MVKHSTNFLWLDLIRGVAAFAVFAGHLRELCFGEIAASMPDLLAKGMYFLTGFGHESVIIFFVLSGFLIIRSVDQDVEKKRWSALHYINNRMTRLWVVLFPALLITLLCDRIGLSLFPDALAYNNKLRFFGGPLIADRLSAGTFFSNLFFLQIHFKLTFGSNSPLWSLACEFWYYATFPLIYFASRTFYRPGTRIILVLLAMSLTTMLDVRAWLYSITWLMGGLSYLIYRSGFAHASFKKMLFSLSVSAVVITLVMMRTKSVPLIFNDYTLALFLALLVPFLTTLPMKAELLKTTATALSNISFTLYVIHQPVIVLLTSATGFQGKTWSYRLLPEFLLYILLVMLLATACWYVFERNTNKFKNWVNRQFIAG